MSHDVWPKFAQLGIWLGRLKPLATLSKSSPCEPTELASYLRGQEDVDRLVYHDSRLAGVIPSTSLVEGLVSRHPSFVVFLPERGPDAHEWQPCSIKK